jgi:carbamoyltransferase
MRILGISAFYHDSAAALVQDGRIVAAAQEERFSRKKHDARFPRHAVAYCLREAGVGLDEVDEIVFYDKPFIKFERLLETYLSFAPRGFASFRMALPLWLSEKLFQERLLRQKLRKFAANNDYRGKLLFAEHHVSHAASAFFASPFDEAAVLTLDGVGEWTTTAMGFGRGNRLEIRKELHFPHSLGLLYSAFTYYTGFKVNSGEYKVMGLAPYGEPKYAQLILDHLVDVKPDGTFRLNLDYFNYCTELTMTNGRFDALFGVPPRKPEEWLVQRHMDLAASIQAVTEEIMLRLSRSVHAETGCDRLCLAGGVALNCVANGKILRDGKFKQIFGFNPRPAMPAALSAPRWPRTTCSTTSRARNATTAMPCKAPSSAPSSARPRWSAASAPRAPASPSCLTAPISTPPPAILRRGGRSAGSRVGWNSAPAPSAHAPCWAIRAHQACSPC